MKAIEYVEKHKAGIIGTIIIHVIALVCFSLWHLPEPQTQTQSVVLLSFEEPEIEEEKIEEPKKEVKEKLATKTPSAESNSNKAVNKSGPDLDSKADYNQYEENLKTETRESVDEQIMKELKALEQEVINEQRAQGIGYTEKEAEALINSKRQSDLKDVPEKKAVSKGAVEGKTNISYRLANRYDVSMFVPVYLCQFGGEVTVNIVVNREGKVVSSKVDNETSKSTDPCLHKAALKAARNTSFNSSAKAPRLQKGSITFQFIAQ